METGDLGVDAGRGPVGSGAGSEWVRDLFPPGELTLVMGRPGVGKSAVALDLAARVSQLWPPPPEPKKAVEGAAEIAEADRPCAVVCSREDPENVVKERLLAAGAYMRYCPVLEGTSLVRIDAPPVIMTEEDRRRARSAVLVVSLHQLVKEGANPTLIVLDPLPSFLENLDCGNGAAVRRVLEPVIAFAGRTGARVIGVSHLTKPRRERENVLDRALGSRAYTALARSVLLAEENPLARGPGDPTYVLVPVKNNRAALTKGLGYWVRGVMPFADDPVPGMKAQPVVEWCAEAVDLGRLPAGMRPAGVGDEAANGGNGEGAREEAERLAVEEAKDFLREALAEGAMASAELRREAGSLGISGGSLKRARKELGVRAWLVHKPRRWMVEYLTTKTRSD